MIPHESRNLEESLVLSRSLNFGKKLSVFQCWVSITWNPYFTYSIFLEVLKLVFLSEVARRSFCIIFSGLIGHLHISLNARKKVSKREARQKIDFGKSADLPEPEAARIVLTFLSHFKWWPWEFLVLTFLIQFIRLYTPGQECGTDKSCFQM